MRKDIAETLRVFLMNGIKPNYSKIAKQFNCDARTVKRYFLNCQNLKRKPRVVVKVLDAYEELVIEKLDLGANAYSIFNFIKKQGYKGGYTTVKNFCAKYKNDKQYKATIRFETNPGVQAQVDWKERFKLKNKNDEIIEVNIFLVILGYSRLKFLMLTRDRTQTTVFKGLLEFFKYIGGVPKEMLFDNMRTIVDRSRTQFNRAQYNERFYAFSKDAGFLPRSCLAYKPKTKGKVEALAKLTDRLKVYNGEFDSYDDLEKIVKEFNEEINNEVSAATGMTPNERFKEEQRYLNPLPKLEIFEEYLNLRPNKRKVTAESLITVEGKKYSVPPEYINLYVFYQITNDRIVIYDELNIEICTHQISDKKINYNDVHYKTLSQMTLDNKEVIEAVCASNLNIYDNI